MVGPVSKLLGCPHSCSLPCFFALGSEDFCLNVASVTFAYLAPFAIKAFAFPARALARAPPAFRETPSHGPPHQHPHQPQVRQPPRSFRKKKVTAPRTPPTAPRDWRTFDSRSNTCPLAEASVGDSAPTARAANRPPAAAAASREEIREPCAGNENVVLVIQLFRVLRTLAMAPSNGIATTRPASKIRA